MIGIVVVAHGAIGTEMVKATKQIVPDVQNIVGVEVDSQMTPESIRQSISKAIKNFQKVDGILILTDMFGGTPSNICLSCLSESSVEVVSGFNLPMLIKLASLQGDSKLVDVVPFIRDYGRKNIVIANQLLCGDSNE